MQKHWWITGLALGMSIMVWRHSVPTAARARDAGHDDSTLDDQVDLVVTVYNSDINVLEQNYEYDLLEPDKLLRKYVGRDVTIVRTRQEGGTTREEPIKARLLSDNNAPVWRIGDEIVTGLGVGQLRFPELPTNLYTRPTLIWTLDNRGAAHHRVEASYLAGKLSWSADYVLTVSRDDGSSDLDGWVTLTPLRM